MLMVIFGAGASYDSVHGANLSPRIDESYRPPLAKDLFANGPRQGDVIDRYPDVRPIIPRLRKASLEGGPTIEREFELIQSEAATIPAHHRMLVAMRYYLRDLLNACASQWHQYAHGVTNYVDLVYRIEKWRSKANARVCLVSFNYDTLLDSACREVLGMTLDDVDAYVGHEHYEVIKPHGSVNWSTRLNRTFDGSMEADDLRRFVIDLGRYLDPSDDVYVTMGSSVQNPVDPSNNCPLVPTIALPLEEKTDAHFVLPRPHLQPLQSAIAETDWLLVVGWRGNEQHFLSLWDSKSPSLRDATVVGREDTEQVVANLTRPGLIGTGCSIAEEKKGFSDFLASDKLEAFLNQLS